MRLQSCAGIDLSMALSPYGRITRVDSILLSTTFGLSKIPSHWTFPSSLAPSFGMFSHVFPYHTVVDFLQLNMHVSFILCMFSKASAFIG